MAAAVPDVQTSATGADELFARPSAKYAADLSSYSTHILILSPLLANETATGVDLEPGQMTTSFTPPSIRPSTNDWA